MFISSFPDLFYLLLKLHTIMLTLSLSFISISLSLSFPSFSFLSYPELEFKCGSILIVNMGAGAYREGLSVSLFKKPISSMYWLSSTHMAASSEHNRLQMRIWLVPGLNGSVEGSCCEYNCHRDSWASVLIYLNLD
jgi:hypothetical protein